MIKRTIEISQKPAHLSVRHDQLVVQPHDEDAANSRTIPCEDIGMVVVDNGRTTYSHHALARIADFGGVLVVCGRDHIPSAILLPLADHSQVVWRINDQISITKPIQKQIWKQLVRAKVRAQAANLVDPSSQRSKLLALARDVRSGDPSNIEAQAAKIYWSAWMKLPSTSSGGGNGDEGDGLDFETSFRRNPDGKDPLNSLLNYGYAILRAAVARAIVAAGFLPAIGIHHSNRSNSFCLADDLLEPLRPIVDRRARDLYRQGRRKLDQPTKAGLLQLLADPVVMGEDMGPLMVNIHRMVASFVKCVQGESMEIDTPRLSDDEP